MRFWRQVGSQNGAKIDIKGGWKNDEKMMMTRMAKKSDIDGYGPARPDDFGPRGGGGRRGKPLPQGSWRKLEDQVEGMSAETQVRNHLSPRGLVGFLDKNMIGYEKCKDVKQ